MYTEKSKVQPRRVDESSDLNLEDKIEEKDYEEVSKEEEDKEGETTERLPTTLSGLSVYLKSSYRQ